MPHLARINVTPLKGAALAHPEAVDLTAFGIPGNRRFFLVDARGRLFSGGAHGPLVRLRVAFDPAGASLMVTFPDGRMVGARADRLGDEHVTDFYGRPVPGRFVVGPLGEAISEFAGHPLRVVRTDVEGDACDEYHLTLVSRASVRDLGTRYARPDLDPLRFRMNLELDGCSPFEEDTWSGREVRIGEAVVRVLGQVPRCVVTTQDPATGVKDFDTLKRISEFRPLMAHPRGVPFGMYAEVEVAGRAVAGDVVELLEA
jgi:hypothetical protein